MESKMDGGIGRLAAGGKNVPFLGMDLEVDVGAALTQVRARQKWRNDEEVAVEAVYTFPLPKGAVLLALEAVMGGRSVRADVAEKEEAEKRYEDALDAGDSAVLLEHSGEGLRTVNLGNLLAGEEMELVLSWSASNSWEDGRLRRIVPTTCAPRYGRDPLKPHQTFETDVGADHRAVLTVSLESEIAGASISSPSHDLKISKVGSKTVATAKRGAFAMDRDIVLDVGLASTSSGAVKAPDRGGEIAWVSFVPTPDAQAEAGPRNVKIVLDCSGSMGGDSISAARQALEKIIGALDPKDHFNLVRFGSSFESMFPAQAPATEANLRLAEACARRVEADMGGTEIAGALRAAYASAGPKNLRGDVILITDGQAWGTDELVAEAKRSGHRVFTVGVGNAVQEELVRRLAEETGAAFELVVPGEAVASAVARQFKRVRGGSVGKAKIEWPGKPQAATSLPAAVFSGDSMSAAARWDGPVPDGKAVLTYKRADGTLAREEIDLAGARSSEDEAYSRTAAAMRLEGAVAAWSDADDTRGRKARKRKEAVKLALEYALLCPLTALVLVRENEEKAVGVPELRRVKHMAPAGMAMLAGASAGGGGILRGMNHAFAANLAFGAASASCLVGGSSGTLGGAQRRGFMAKSAVRSFSSAPTPSGAWNSTGPDFSFESFGAGSDTDSLFDSGADSLLGFDSDIDGCASDGDFSLADAGSFDMEALRRDLSAATGSAGGRRSDLALAKALESRIVAEGAPKELSWLAFLGLDAGLAAKIAALAERVGAEKALAAWISSVLSAWSRELTMAGKVLAEDLADLAGADLTKEAGAF